MRQVVESARTGNAESVVHLQLLYSLSSTVVVFINHNVSISIIQIIFFNKISSDFEEIILLVSAAVKWTVVPALGASLGLSPEKSP